MTVKISNVSATASNTGVLKAGAVVTFTVGINQPVTVTGSPILELNDGGAAVYDPVASQPGGTPSNLVFRYVVQQGDVTTDLTVVALTLAGGSIHSDGALYLNAPKALNVGSEPVALIAADVDGDKKPDLAVVNYGDGTVSILLNQNTALRTAAGLDIKFGPATSFAVGARTTALAVGDIDRDDLQDLVVTDASSNQIYVLKGDGRGGFTSFSSTPTGPDPTSVAVGLIDKDQKLDVVVTNADKTVTTLLGDGKGAFYTPDTYGTGIGSAPTSARLADLTGDGKPDLVEVNSRSNSVSVLLNDGTGTFGAGKVYRTGSGPTGVVVADLNGDGKLDMAVTNGNDDTVSVFLGDGSGGFGSARTYATGHTPVALAVADIDGDGKADLVTANQSGSVSVLVGKGDGTFLNPAMSDAGDTPSSIAVADFDGDGLNDIAVTNSGDNTISILKNTSVLAGDLVTSSLYLHAASLDTKLTVDASAASVVARTASPVSGSFAAGTVLTLTLSFSKAVAISGTGKVALTLNDGGTAAYVSGSGTTDLVFQTTVAAGQNAATLSVTGVTSPLGTALFDLGGSLADLTRAAGSFGNVSVDTTAPTITADVASPGTGRFGTGQVIMLTITGSEALTVTGSPSLKLNDGGTATYVSGSGTASLVFKYTIAQKQNTANLAVTGVTLPAGAAINDAAGNPAVLAGASTVFTGLQIDTTAPVVIAIVASPVSGSFDVGQGITFTLTFSEPVKVYGTVVLTLNDGGTAAFTGATVQKGGGESGTLSFRTTVAAGQNVAALAVTGVSLAAGAQVYGMSGNAYFGSAVASFPTISVNTGVPTVKALVAIPGNASLSAGALVTLDLKMTKPVLVTGGTPTLTLNDGAVATYVSGSGTDTLVFTSTVASGQSTPDLAVTALNPNGAVVADRAGRAAILSGAVANPAGTLDISAQAVTVLSFAAVPSVTGPLGVGRTVDFTATLSGGVSVSTGAGVPTLTLNDGGTAAYDAASSTATSLVFRTTIAAGQNAANLTATGLTLNGAAIKVPDSPLAFAGPTIDTAPENARAAAVADVDGDGQLDVVVGGYETAVLLGDGNGGFFPARTVGGNVLDIAVADVNHDGRPDLLTVDANAGLVVQLGDGTGGFGAGVTIAGTDDHDSDLYPDALAVGDLNGDGAPDVVIFGFRGQIQVSLGDGAGGFGAPVSYGAATGGDYQPRVLLADLNGDGKLDVVAAPGQKGVTVMLGDGAGGFGATTILPSASGENNFSRAVIADFNGDGRPDIAAVNNFDLSVWLGQAGGGFGRAIDLKARPNRELAAADLNGDGKVDLVTGEYQNGRLDIYLGDGTGGFSAPNFVATYEKSTLLTSDLNADGRPDILGLNSLVVGTTRHGEVGVLLNGTIAPNVFDPAGAATATGRVTGLVVDTTAPTITAVSASPGRGSYDVGRTFALTLTGSEALVVTGTPVLTLNDGGTARYTGGSGTNSLQFTTTVLAGQNAAALAVTGVTLPPGASIRDAAGNDAALAGAAATIPGLSVVTAVASVLSVAASPGTATLGAGAVVSLSVVFNKPVAVSRGAPTLTLSSGGVARYVSGSGSDTLVFSTTVAAGQATPDLAVTAFNPNGALVADRGGRAANLAGAVANPAGTLAIAAPAVTARFVLTAVQAGGTPASGPLVAGQTVTFSVALSGAVTVAGQPTLALNDGGTAFYDAAASTATSLVFRTTITAGQNTPNLTVTAMTLNGATIAIPGSLALGAATATSLIPASYAPSMPHLRADLDGNTFSDDITVNPAKDTVTVGLYDPVTNREYFTDYATGASPQSLAVLDVNGDDFVDLLVADAGSGSVSVLLGTGDGTFGTASSVLVNGGASTPRSVTILDADGDGRPDIRVASGTSVFLLHGDGAGRFSASGAGASASAVTLADVDGDGRMDAVVAVKGIDQAAVLLGDGRGGFGAPALYGVGRFPTNVTVADLNHDGRPDLVVSDNGFGALSILLGTGGGRFAAATTVAIDGGNSAPGSVTAIDVNGDGNPDLLVDAGSGVDVLVGDGAGGFSLGGTFASGFVAAATAADVNGDGRPDLIIIDSGDLSDPALAVSSVSVLLADGSGGFGAPAAYAAGNGPGSVTAADVDGDGRADLIVTNQLGGDVSVLLGNGFGGFLSAVDYAAGVVPTGVVAADVNGDGRPDLVVSGAGEVFVLPGLGGGAFGTAVRYGAGVTLNGAVSAADLNGDGRPDLVVAGGDGSLYTLLNGSAAPGAFALASASSAPGAMSGLVVDTASAPCYVTGTAILTERGEVAVEALSIGDMVVTASGRLRPIKWLGHRRVDCARHPDPGSVRPVRVRAHAFGAGLPRRDLVLSPEHALFLDGMLVPVRALADGVSIIQEAWDRVTYHHVELDSHDILLAEGLAAESYLDTGNRTQFANNPLVTLHARFDPGETPAEPCAPLLVNGPRLEMLRSALRQGTEARAVSRAC